MKTSLRQDISSHPMEDSIQEPVFRPAKRRKFMRKRQDEESSEHIDAIPSPPRPHPAGEEQSRLDEEDLSVAEIIRLRKLRKNRKGGIEFSNSPSQSHGTPGALVTQETEAGAIKDMTDRFTPHTGQVVDANKHMYVNPILQSAAMVTETDEIRMEYIESELAKRRQVAGQSALSHSNPATYDETIYGPGGERMPQRQPASLGKLHEIDLGPDATMKNIARTEAAARRAAGELVQAEEEPGGKKPRLGKNGKPWRGRRRRNSEDAKRDQLVEEVLRESKLEIYDEPEMDLADGDQAADDRIAEQFRRDFMDAIQSRRQRTTQKKNPKDAKVEGPKGPKLGGSRSARAAMHKLQEEAAKK